MDAAEPQRRARFAIVVVVAPLVIGVGASLLDGAIPDRAPRGSYGPQAWLDAAPGAVFWAVVTTVLVTMRKSFSTDRRRNRAWPLAIALAGLAFVGVLAITASSGLPLLVGAIGAGGVGGLVGWRVARAAVPPGELPSSQAPAPPEAIRYRTLTEHTAVWTGRAPHQGWAGYRAPACVTALGFILIASFTAAADVVWPIGTIAMTSLLVANATFVHVGFSASRVRVTIGPSGFTVRNGVTKRAVASIELDHVDSAWHTTAPNPSFSVGWGKESTRRRLAFLTRGGPALLVRLTDASDVVVSLDEPAEAAAVVNTLLDQRATTAHPVGRNAR